MTIAVPRDASPGERYGAVWAEARATPVAGQGITEINRVGMRMYLSVGPGGPPAAGFRIQSLVAARASDGRPLVRAQVHNTGGRALDMSGTLRLLQGPGGLAAGPFPARTGTTLGPARPPPSSSPSMHASRPARGTRASRCAAASCNAVPAPR